jgi:DnaA family protein
MRQLALDLRLAEHARFDSYYAGPNELAVAALREVATNPAPRVIWLWGAAGSGRSHLLQACVAAGAEHDTACAWLPCGPAGGLVPEMLEGMGALSLVCIDDIDAIAGIVAWERALFGLFEELREHRGRLVVSAAAAPGAVHFGLRDLGSRLASGPTYRLAPLDDGDRLQALRARARWRGFELSDETGRFLLRRVERSNAALFAMLDELDVAALTAQRRLTIPFVKAALGID